jgi:hypothetical protein
MATREEVRHKAGRMLGIVRFGQSLRTEDDSLLSESYTQVYDTLKNKGLAIWASTADLPDRVVPHVGALVAFNVADDKATSTERYNRIVSKRNVAMREIRSLVTPSHESLDKTVDY